MLDEDVIRGYLWVGDKEGGRAAEGVRPDRMIALDRVGVGNSLIP